MTALELARFLKRGGADRPLAELYGGRAIAFQKKRYLRLLARLAARFPDAEAALFRAPGRTEIGGNHTDHNGGRVLAAAVNLDIACAAVKTADGRVTLASPSYPRPVSVDLTDARRRQAERGTTAALVRGLVRFLMLPGRVRPGSGFFAELDATLPQGAGLSSSAAIETLVATVFNEWFPAGGRPLIELARACRRAENEYYGKPCGLMDQIASLYGGAASIDFARPEAPSVSPIVLDPESAGYALFAVATGGGHADLTVAYAAVPADMRAVAACFGKKTLRDVRPADVARSIAAVRRKAGDRAVLRTLHFFAENERAAKQAALLRGRDFEGFLALVRTSGDSSWELLQNCLLPEKPRKQGLALGLALSREFIETRAAGRGAARVHGGGFAGTLQCYVPISAVRAYRSAMEAVFGRGSAIRLRLCPRGAIRVL